MKEIYFTLATIESWLDSFCWKINDVLYTEHHL